MNRLRDSFALLEGIVFPPHGILTTACRTFFLSTVVPFTQPNMTSFFPLPFCIHSFFSATKVMNTRSTFKLPPALFFYHPRSASRPPLRFASLEEKKKACLERRNMPHDATATHIDNPTIGAPRFSETCFTSVHVYHHKSKHGIRIKSGPYLRKNFRVLIVCNLVEAVSVTEMRGGARLGTHSLHDRTSALRGIPGLPTKFDNSSNWSRVLYWKNVPRRCPNQRILKIEVN